MTVVTTNKFISVHPEDLKFQFELEKQCHCDLKLGNSTDKHVAFKVKTTSPKKYFVRPNTGVIQPWDSCVITVTLQPQRESPPDMQCKDKFLLQSTQVAPHTDIDELPLDTFNKESGRIIEELKLRVVYILPESGSANTEVKSKPTEDTSAVMQRIRSERDAAVHQTQQLKRELGNIRACNVIFFGVE
ncbi:vesicle-associated protein 2-1-like isoform X2 [Apium graveolens]|uniref:vesicle-associated protein 2-1-like isoform X2 n=1 Tax=Apium graveolens TaxID=4045 RepID=UPI003D79DED7